MSYRRINDPSGLEVEPSTAGATAARDLGGMQRHTWRTHVREIAVALGIPLNANQWVVLESGDDDGNSEPLTRTVDVIVWEAIGE